MPAIQLRSTFEELDEALEPALDSGVPADAVLGDRLTCLLTLRLPCSSSAKALETVAEHLTAYPLDYAHVTAADGSAGRHDVDAALAHAEALEALPSPSSFRAAGRLHDWGTRFRAHTSGTYLLVAGVYRRGHSADRVGVLTAVDGTRLLIRPGGRAEPPDGAHIWALAHATLMPSVYAQPFFELYVWHHQQPAGLFLPQYEPGSSPVESYAQSWVNDLLVTWSTVPPDIEVVRAWLRVIHAPTDLQEMSHGCDMHFRRTATDLITAATPVPSLVTDAAQPVMPAPRMVKSAAAAEEYASDVMRALGYTDARTTVGGADGGIDVWSSRAVAQVKMEAVLTGRPQLQQLVGIARTHEVDALFFSLAGYTAQAREWAEQTGVACFEFAFDGSLTPVGAAAARLLTQGAC